jgi:hypothetical protein
LAHLTSTHRTLLHIQGFDDVDDATLSRTQHWLRVAPALCGVIALMGTVLAAPWILWSLAVTAAAGAVLPFHPFDLIYNVGVRRFAHTPELPHNGAPRRFACALGSVWLIATGTLFAVGYSLPAYTLGGALVGVAALVATTHICIPSMIFRTACGQMPSVLAREI